MDILKGLLYINDEDAYEEYGVFLSEEKPGDAKNYSALMKPSKAKSHTPVDFREQDGEKYPVRLVPALEARNVELQFTLEAADKDTFFIRYGRFVSTLKNGAEGWLSFYLPEINRTYRFFYLECSSWNQLTTFEGKVYASFKVKFREPNPVF